MGISRFHRFPVTGQLFAVFLRGYLVLDRADKVLFLVQDQDVQESRGAIHLVGPLFPYRGPRPVVGPDLLERSPDCFPQEIPEEVIARAVFLSRVQQPCEDVGVSLLHTG